jgi:hypothetical protein
MGRLATVWREILGLFIDDGSLAAAILAWLAGGMICIRFFNVAPAGEAFILATGFVLLLGENVERTARKTSRGKS